MKHKKKRAKELNGQRKRHQGVTWGEVSKAINIQNENPDKIATSPRLQKALAVWKEKGPAFRDALDRALLPLTSVEKRFGHNLERIDRNLRENPEAPVGSMDMDQVIEVLRALEMKKGARIKAQTREKIRLAAELTRQGVTQYRQAASLFPGKPLKQGYDHTRAFYRRHREEIRKEMSRQSEQSSRVVQPSSKYSD